MRALLVALMLLILTKGAFADVNALSWIAGDWQGQHEWGLVQEHYSKPDGGTILGTSRMLSEGKTSFTEFLLFQDGPDGVRLTLTMGTGRVVRLGMVRCNESEAVFESLDPEKPERLTYRRVDDGLDIVLEKQQDGKPWSTTFHLRKD